MQPTAALALTGVASLLCRVGWFAWDTQVTLDPVTSNETGPYEAWQVVGAVLGLGLITVIAARHLRVLTVVLAVSGGFALGFLVAGATSSYADGLSVLGAALLFVGMLPLTALADAVSRRIRNTRRRRPVPSA